MIHIHRLQYLSPIVSIFGWSHFGYYNRYILYIVGPLAIPSGLHLYNEKNRIYIADQLYRGKKVRTCPCRRFPQSPSSLPRHSLWAWPSFSSGQRGSLFREAAQHWFQSEASVFNLEISSRVIFWLDEDQKLGPSSSVILLSHYLIRTLVMW